MAANTEKVTFRLTPDQVENLDSIMLDRDIQSRSHVIRMAIESFISENLIDAAAQKVVVHLPTNTVNRLVDCVSAGDVLNIENAIQMSVDHYLTSIEDYYLIKRKQLSEARMDYRKEISTKLAANEAIKK